MGLKCVYCGGAAEFVIGGNSLCLKHLPPELKMRMNLPTNNRTKRKAIAKSAPDYSNILRVPMVKKNK